MSVAIKLDEISLKERKRLRKSGVLHVYWYVVYNRNAYHIPVHIKTESDARLWFQYNFSKLVKEEPGETQIPPRTFKVLMPAFEKLVPIFETKRGKKAGPNYQKSLIQLARKNVLTDPIADIELTKITASDAGAFWDRLGQFAIGLDTKHRVLSCIRLMFNQLTTVEVSNPFNDSRFKERKVPRLSAARERREVFSLPESSVLAIAGGEATLPVLWYHTITLALYTGMRLEEVFGLQWRDVDWTEKTIEVVRQIYKGGDGETAVFINEPKWGSYRSCLAPNSLPVPLHPFVFDMLTKWKATGYRAYVKHYVRDPNAKDPIFPTVEGEFAPRHNHGAKAVQAALLAVGQADRTRSLRNADHVFTFQDLRHTFGTRLGALGVPIEVSGKMLGHKPKSVTDANYTKPSLDVLRRAIGQLGSPVVAV